MSEYTPGPWVVENENDVYAFDELLATAYPMKRDGVCQSWKGNVRIMAAAPEMLEALKKALEVTVKFCPIDCSELVPISDLLEKVIRHAEEGA